MDVDGEVCVVGLCMQMRVYSSVYDEQGVRVQDRKLISPVHGH